MCSSVIIFNRAMRCRRLLHKVAGASLSRRSATAARYSLVDRHAHIAREIRRARQSVACALRIQRQSPSPCESAPRIVWRMIIAPNLGAPLHNAGGSSGCSKLIRIAEICSQGTPATSANALFTNVTAP